MTVLTLHLLLFQIDMLRADTEAEKRSKHEVPPNDEGNVTYEIKPCAV